MIFGFLEFSNQVLSAQYAQIPKRLSKMPKIGKIELLPCFITVAHIINFKPEPTPLNVLLDGQIWAFWNP